MRDSEFTEAILDTLSALVAVLDKDGKIVKFNRACEITTGYTEKEVIGKSFRSIFAYEELDFEKKQNASVAYQYPAEYLNPIVSKCGKRKIIQWRNAAVCDKFRQLEYVIATGVDITGAKHIEDALRESEARFHSVLDNSRDLVFRYNIQSKRFEYISPSALNVTGYSSEELLSRDIKSMQALVYSDDIHAIYKALAQLEADGEAEITYRQHHKNGTWRWVICGMSLIKNKQGQSLYYDGNLRDITESKNVEVQLSEKEERLRLAIVAGDMGTWEWDVNKNELIWNKKQFELLGLTPATGKIKPDLFMAHVYPEDKEKVERGLERLVEHRGEIRDEYRIINESGEIRWIIVVGRFYCDPEKKTKRAVGINFDITKQKQLEAALRQRVLELAAANRELESFSYSVSHDLRAPLRSITGFDQFLLEDYADKLDDTGKEYLRRIRDSASKMNILIDDMLKLAKVSRQMIEKKEINLSEICWGVIGTLRENYPERNVKIYIEKDIRIQADGHLMNIAMTNLINNAWKYTGKKMDALIEVKSGEQHRKKCYIVRDNGAGFDMKFADQLFKPFKRFHSESEFTGTGVGLAIVESIIRRHGGNIWAESEPGKGTSFYFTLP